MEMSICIYANIGIHIYICMYMYICMERKRTSERDMSRKERKRNALDCVLCSRLHILT